MKFLNKTTAILLGISLLLVLALGWVGRAVSIEKIDSIKITFLSEFKSLGLSYYTDEEDFYENVIDILKSGRKVDLVKHLNLDKDGAQIGDKMQSYQLSYSLLDNSYQLFDEQIGILVNISQASLKREILGTHRLWLNTSLEKPQGIYKLTVKYSMQPEDLSDTLLANIYRWRMHKAFTAEGIYEVLD